VSAYAYVRVSTDEQRGGAGLRAQVEACAAAAAPQSLLQVFADEGVSGATSLDSRPALLLALEVLKAGDMLFVAKRDRLGRDPIAVAMIERAIERKSARVISGAGEGTEGDDPSHVLMRRLVDAFAEYERLVISARTSAALQAKKRAGQRIGSIPFGYRLGKDASQVLPDAREQAVIRRVEELRKGGLSLRRISAVLRSEGYTARTGRQFAASQVQRMLGGKGS
jgi:site-specific DNA recombinase